MLMTFAHWKAGQVSALSIDYFVLFGGACGSWPQLGPHLRSIVGGPFCSVVSEQKSTHARASTAPRKFGTHQIWLCVHMLYLVLTSTAIAWAASSLARRRWFPKGLVFAAVHMTSV